MPARRQKTSAQTLAAVNNIAELDAPYPGSHGQAQGLSQARGEFTDDAIAREMGLGPSLDDDGDFDRAAIRAELCDLHRTTETLKEKLAVSPTLQNNMGRPATLVGLSGADCGNVLTT